MNGWRQLLFNGQAQLLLNSFPFDELTACIETLSNARLESTPEYIQEKQNGTELISQLDELLEKERKQLKCAQMKYRHLGNQLYQMEVPKRNINIQHFLK